MCLILRNRWSNSRSISSNLNLIFFGSETLNFDYACVDISSTLQGLASLTMTAIGRTRSSNRHKTLMPSSFLTLSLYIISLGQGGYNPSLQAFGADQLDEEEELPCSKDDENSNKKTLFFQWWYFGICGGSLMGVTIMSYVQDTFGWVLGFAIPAISMALSILIFSAGSPIYLFKHHDHSDKPNNNKPFISLLLNIRSRVLKCFPCGTTPPIQKSEVTELE